jgi:hypothetical protein
LSGFRQARQTLPASRDVVYAQFGRADPDRLDHVPGLQGMTNETEAAPGSIPKFIEPWILAPSATGLSKPDLHVFAKLFEDCLKRGLEAQAFSGREIGGHDDVLDFLVGHFVDVDLTRQPAS